MSPYQIHMDTLNLNFTIGGNQLEERKLVHQSSFELAENFTVNEKATQDTLLICRMYFRNYGLERVKDLRTFG